MGGALRELAKAFQSGASGVYKSELCRGLSWQVQLALRSSSRLRVGELVLGYANGHRSVARFLECIFCGMKCERFVIHALAECNYWAERRARAEQLMAREQSASDQETALAFLGLAPGKLGFMEVVLWAKSLDMATIDWWNEHE